MSIEMVFGKRRAVSIEFRIMHVPTGHLFLLYPGQLKNFCDTFKLNYYSAISCRSKYPTKEIPLYTFISSIRRHQINAEYKLLPAILTQIRP